MRLYELHIVLKPTLNEERLNHLVSELGETLAQSNFGITASQTKLNERLPYCVKGCAQAHFLNIEVSGPEDTSLPEEIDFKLKHNEDILRTMVLAKPEKILKKSRPLPIFSEQRPFRPERKSAVLAEPPSHPTDTAGEHIPMDAEEVDRKLEEILK